MKATVDLEDYLDAEVMDVDSKLVGTLRCFWSDADGAAIFLGVKTSWTPDETVVVPVALAEPNEYHSCVVLRASEEELRRAPTLPCDESLSPRIEDRAYEVFEIDAPARRSELQINRAAANKLHSGKK